MIVCIYTCIRRLYQTPHFSCIWRGGSSLYRDWNRSIQITADIANLGIKDIAEKMDCRKRGRELRLKSFSLIIRLQEYQYEPEIFIHCLAIRTGDPYFNSGIGTSSIWPVLSGDYWSFQHLFCCSNSVVPKHFFPWAAFSESKFSRTSPNCI